MKVVLFALIAIALSSCSKTDTPTPIKPSLVNTRWSTFSFKAFIDGSNVYQILRFKSETEVEVYSATEKTAIIGDIEVRTYSYNDPALTITSKNIPATGQVSTGMIRIYGKDYTKEN